MALPGDGICHHAVGVLGLSGGEALLEHASGNVFSTTYRIASHPVPSQPNPEVQTHSDNPKVPIKMNSITIDMGTDVKVDL